MDFPLPPNHVPRTPSLAVLLSLPAALLVVIVALIAL
jgi:hypothetical protein